MLPGEFLIVHFFIVDHLFIYALPSSIFQQLPCFIPRQFHQLQIIFNCSPSVFPGTVFFLRLLFAPIHLRASLLPSILCQWLIYQRRFRLDVSLISSHQEFFHFGLSSSLNDVFIRNVSLLGLFVLVHSLKCNGMLIR